MGARLLLGCLLGLSRPEARTDCKPEASPPPRRAKARGGRGGRPEMTLRHVRRADLRQFGL
jgi:hypothetical protein